MFLTTWNLCLRGSPRVQLRMGPFLPPTRGNGGDGRRRDMSSEGVSVDPSTCLGLSLPWRGPVFVASSPSSRRSVVRVRVLGHRYLLVTGLGTLFPRALNPSPLPRFLRLSPRLPSERRRGWGLFRYLVPGTLCSASLPLTRGTSTLPSPRDPHDPCPHHGYLPATLPLPSPLSLLVGPSAPGLRSSNQPCDNHSLRPWFLPPGTVRTEVS